MTNYLEVTNAKVFDSTQMEAIGRVQASLENMLKESCSSSAQV